jgi:cytochrome b561
MPRYPTVLIVLHWLTALALLTAYVSSGDPTHAKSAYDVFAGQLHIVSGALVFALVALRLPLRALLGTPALAAAARWQQGVARAMHWGLYALMLLVPVAGWAALSVEVGKKSLGHFALAGGFDLPLLDAHTAWVGALGSAHQTLGNAFIWLAGLHAAAALFHHYWLRDTTLLRMAPLAILKR